MNTQIIDKLLNQAEELSVDERLILIERLAESIRQVQPVFQISQETEVGSKWARLAQQIKENPIDLGNYTAQLKQDM